MDLRDAFEEGEELDVAVPRVAGVGADLAGRNLQRGEQGGGAVANVVMGLPCRPTRPQRQSELGPVHGLDLGLLVDRHHDGACRRILARCTTPAGAVDARVTAPNRARSPSRSRKAWATYMTRFSPNPNVN